MSASSAAAPSNRSAGREVVLFHSVLGLRPAVHRWADRLRAGGHVVHTPDLYEGRSFDEYDPAFQFLETIGGIETLMTRSHASVDGLPADLVYAGFSNGAASAELLALTRPGARGAVLMHGALPVQLFGAEAWPAGVPVQLHQAVDDPFREPEADAAFTASVNGSGARLEAFDYPITGHLFADDGLPEYDAASAESMMERVLAFLRTV